MKDPSHFRNRWVNFRFVNSKILILSIFLGAVFTLFSVYFANLYIKKAEEQRLIHLKQLVELARSSIEPILDQYRNSKISRDEALEESRNLARRLIYHDNIGNNYIFMSSYGGIMLVQPFEPENEMTNMWDLKDSNGVHIVQELVKAAKTEKQGGYVSYHYKTPGSSIVGEKTSYVIGIPELEAFMGTGIYVDDIRKNEVAFIINTICLVMAFLILLIIIVISSLKEIKNQNLMLRRENADRKLAEDALKSSQQKVFLHLKHTPLANIELDPEFKVAEWNPAAEKIFGYTKKEALGRHVTDLIVPGCARVRVDDVWEALLKQKGGRRSTNENITKLGEIIHCEWFNTPLIDKNGKVIGISSFAQDITDRIRVEKQLHLTKYSVDNNSSPTFWIRQNGRFSYTNKTSCELTGYSQQEMLNSRLWDIDTNSSLDTFSAHLEELDEKGTQTFESVITDKYGKQLPVEVNTHLLEFEGEKYVFATMLDITERRKSETERSRLGSVIEQSSDSVVITDLKGNIEYVNPAFESNTGYSRTEVFGKNLQILKSNEHDDEYYKNLLETVTSGQFWAGNMTNKTKGGDLIEEFVKIFPILSSDGEIKNFASVSHDMTEQNKMENQLKQAQKMEAIGTLTGGIAHDFNNVLSPIFAYSQLLERKLQTEDENILQFIDNIRKAAFRASDLVIQILNISRKFESKKEVVVTIPIINETLKLLRSALPSTISINSSIEAENSCVLCDPTQIHQVLMNLAVNAGHAMQGKNGTLEMNVSNFTEYKGDLHIDKGNYLLITVRDTGVGMSQETKERIFEPFFTTKKIGEGTGLGLSVTYRIIESLGGYIYVYSELNMGTKFHVYLPVAEGKAVEDSKTPEQFPTGTETILLVDDEKLNVFSYTTLLEDQGYTVEGFTESLKAYEAFISNPEKYNLILTDYTMPDLTGLKLADKIREQNFKIPVVLITGLSEAISDDDLEQVQIKKILSKPIDLYDLAVAVRNALDEQTQVAETLT